MNSKPWNSNSDSDSDGKHSDSTGADQSPGEWSLDDVLRQTEGNSQGDDVLETIAKLRQESPGSKPSEIDTMTRFVLSLLKRRFPDMPLQNEKLLTMASTIAQSIIEDPVASQRMNQLWLEAN